MKTVKILIRALSLIGLNPVSLYHTVRGLPRYLSSYLKLSRQIRCAGGSFPFGMPYPCLQDVTAGSGTASGHYFHQDLLVATRIFETAPDRHIDVGSRVDGFVAHVASFRQIDVIDIRPQANTIRNIRFIAADFMAELPDFLVGACDSVSCLHALEHFGLGRYGDPVDHTGHLTGLDNLLRMLRPGGRLFLSVPIGPSRIEFNAHRVFSISYLLDVIGDRATLDRFSYVDDKGSLHENMSLDSDRINENCGCNYGCGIFELTRT